MKQTHWLLIVLTLFAGFLCAEDITGTYEIPSPDSETGDMTTVQFSTDDEGKYSAQVSMREWSIDATNVVVNDDEFSFDTQVNLPFGERSQSWKGTVKGGEITLSVSNDFGGQSYSETLYGKRVKAETEDEAEVFVEKKVERENLREDTPIQESTESIEDLAGTYEIPPPDGETGDTTVIHLLKDDAGKYSAQVSMREWSVEATNVTVNDDAFAFDTKVELQFGERSQFWKGEVLDGELTLSVSIDFGGQSYSETLYGRRVNAESDN